MACTIVNPASIKTSKELKVQALKNKKRTLKEDIKKQEQLLIRLKADLETCEKEEFYLSQSQLF